jgi:hypothetical protein
VFADEFAEEFVEGEVAGEVAAEVPNEPPFDPVPLRKRSEFGEIDPVIADLIG